MEPREYITLCEKRKAGTVTCDKTVYLDVMEKCLSSYMPAYFLNWCDEIEKNGITEHGFPRVAANLGILIAHGRLTHMFDLWHRMMNDCCALLPAGVAANDFAIKEIMLCLFETRHLVSSGQYEEWLAQMGKIDPYKNYACIAKHPTHRVGNWAAYNVAGEYLREYAGLTDTTEYFKAQMPAQLYYFDENGMYKDPHEPMLYDIATRCQFMVMGHFGYNGQYAKELDENLKKAGLYSLLMQSSAFEFPFGGRSNQYLFNEAYMAACFEYEANRYYKKGELGTAGMYKRAARLAVSALGRWLDAVPAKHIKNLYPYNSYFGAEGYGYYDKYMISLASFIYLTFLFADDDIAEYLCPAELGGYVIETSDSFHKIFANCSGYSLEFEKKANYTFESTGLGRLHKTGVPTEFALSLSISKKAGYYLSDRRFSTETGKDENNHFHRLYDIWAEPRYKGNTGNLSMCSGIMAPDGSVLSIADLENGLECSTDIIKETPGEVILDVTYRSPAFCGFTFLKERYIINEEGLKIEVSSDCESDRKIIYSLGVVKFNGAEESQIEIDGNIFSAKFMNHLYSGKTNGFFIKNDGHYRNRNGKYYSLTAVSNENVLDLKLNLI